MFNQLKDEKMRKTKAFTFLRGTVLQDYFVVITANDPRDVMLQNFGEHWGFEYDYDEYFMENVVEPNNLKMLVKIEK